MTASLHALSDQELDRFAPSLSSDSVSQQFDTELVMWARGAPAPTALNPVATVLAQLFDGQSTVGEIIADVSDVIGVPSPIARNQVRRVLAQLETGGLLSGQSQAVLPPAFDDFFVGPPNP